MKRSVYAFILSSLAALPAALALGTPSTSNAANRRMLAADVCTSGINVSNKIGSGTYNPIGVVGNNDLSSSSQVSCMVPSDSYFPHGSTNQINVHVQRNAAHSNLWRLGARACMQSFTADTYQCGNAYFVPDTTLGEKTISLGANQLTVWKHADYVNWGSYVAVTFRAADVVRFVYSRT